jgi:hypothetical protein
MIYEAGYNIIELFSATKGMNQNVSPDKITNDYSYYIENIMPESLGEGTVRYGTSLFCDVTQGNVQDKPMKAFPFSSENGSKQQVLYFNGYQTFSVVSNLRIISANHIRLTSVNYNLFKLDTLLQLRYRDKYGLSAVSTYEIKNITTVDVNTIDIEVEQNSFAENIVDFYINAPGAPNPQYISGTQFSITVPADFIPSLFYSVGQSLKLTINDVVVNLVISVIDTTVGGEITFTTTGDEIPIFSDVDTRTLSFKSSTPELSVIFNSYGYIKVLDVATATVLAPTIAGLSVACVPRAEFFAKKLWICNGVDPIMTWNGVDLEIYEETVKDSVQAFNRIDARNFSFIVDATFDINKYDVGKSIYLTVSGIGYNLIVSAIIQAGNLVTITTTDDLPEFTGQLKVELFYYDRPPAFSFMKAAHDRLWCLGAGAVSLSYRIPDLAMRFYYSYKPYSDESPFKFFYEKTKAVPSEDISAKHGISDNLEAIVDISGKLIFMGRQKSQVWRGIDPITKGTADYFSWESTIPVGVYHGDLIVELANDAQFLTQNGFVSFGTLNIANQFAASNTDNMDNLASEYINSINSNIQYRSCSSFKYNSGGFCGFKIGQNNVIVSKYNTSFYWWGIFSGDFTNSSCFLSILDECLYLYLGSKIYKYADGFGNSPTVYGDLNGTRFIDFVETKYVNNIKRRYANKRYEIESEYSSSLVINEDNKVNIYISGNLRDTFTIQDVYKLPFRGDVLGTINLVDGSKTGSNPNNPSGTVLGMRLDSPYHNAKGRLKFLSNIFSVTIVGKIKNGPFSLRKIRLFGVSER